MNTREEKIEGAVWGAVAVLVFLVCTLCGCAVESEGLVVPDADVAAPDVEAARSVVVPKRGTVSIPDVQELPPDAGAPEAGKEAAADVWKPTADAGPPVSCPDGKYLVIEDVVLRPNSDATVRAYSCSTSKQDAAPDVIVVHDPNCTDNMPDGNVTSARSCKQFADEANGCYTIWVKEQGACRASCGLCTP